MLAVGIAAIILSVITFLIVSFLLSMVDSSLTNKVESVTHVKEPTYKFIPIPVPGFRVFFKLIGLLMVSTILIVTLVHIHTDQPVDPGFALLVLSGLSMLTITGTIGFCLAYFRLVKK